MVNNNNQTFTNITTKETSHNASALWNRISEQLEKTMFKQKNLLLSRLFGESLNSPGLIEVLASSINIMQDRINHLQSSLSISSLDTFTGDVEILGLDLDPDELTA